MRRVTRQSRSSIASVPGRRSCRTTPAAAVTAASTTTPGRHTAAARRREPRGQPPAAAPATYATQCPTRNASSRPDGAAGRVHQPSPPPPREAGRAIGGPRDRPRAVAQPQAVGHRLVGQLRQRAGDVRRVDAQRPGGAETDVLHAHRPGGQARPAGPSSRRPAPPAESDAYHGAARASRTSRPPPPGNPASSAHSSSSVSATARRAPRRRRRRVSATAPADQQPGDKRHDGPAAAPRLAPTATAAASSPTAMLLPLMFATNTWRQHQVPDRVHATRHRRQARPPSPTAARA